MEDLSSCKKRGRDDSDELGFEFEFEFGLQEVKRIKDDLLGFLDDSELCTTSQELDSFMKSFEQEISSSSAPDSGHSRPDLGYLLKASDDDLGIPPSTTEDEKTPVEANLFRVASTSPELGELFGDEFSGFDSFEYGIDQGFGFSDNSQSQEEFVGLDGLFDYSDLGFGSTESPWRPETLPAQ